MAKRHKDAPKTRVFLDGIEQSNVHCLDATLGSGDVLPSASLEVLPPGRKPGRRTLKNMSLARFNQTEVVVLIGTEVVHWGKVLAQSVTLTGDVIRMISRMEDHHFGTPLAEALFWNAQTRRTVTLTLPTIFNPEDDGRVFVNLAVAGFPQKLSFIHPDCTRTPAGLNYHGGRFFWDLQDAVRYLCTTLNPDETYVKNPTQNELSVLPLVNILRNHTCPVGEHLPAQLTRLLAPHGFSWTVDFVNPRLRKIRVFRRSGGEPRLLKLQPSGADLDMSLSNLEALQVTSDVSTRAFNSVRILGDYTQHESTFQLVKAWKEDLDDRDEYELSKNSDAWEDNADLKNVWRKWVLNEGGDYNNLRPEIRRPYDFNSLFGAGQYIQRRRKFEPCISIQSDGTPQGHAGGVFIEWWDKFQAAWLPIDQLGSESRQIRVLDGECGILFDGLEIPTEIKQQGSDAKIRVTASVASDQRAEAVVTRPLTLLKDFKQETFDMGSRFKIRKRHTPSIFHQSSNPPSNPNSTEEDDTAEMKLLANQLLDNFNLASIDGTATLTGIDYDFSGMIGTTVSGISGRGVDFNVAPLGSRFPTVVGAKINIAGQATEVVLDTFRGSPL